MADEAKHSQEALLAEIARLKKRVAQTESAPPDGSDSVKYEQLAAHIPRTLNARTRPALWQTLHEAAQQIIGVAQTAVFLWDPVEAQLQRPFIAGFSDQFIAQTNPHLAELPTATAMQQSTPTIVPDLSAETGSLSVRSALLLTEGVRSIASFPLVVEDDVYGALTMYGRSPHAFTDVDVHIGQTLAQTGAATLRNLMLLADAADTLHREQRRNEMAFTLSNSFDQPQILLNVIRMATELIGADAGLLGLLIDSQMMIFYPHNISPTISLRPAARKRGVAWTIVETRKSILLDDYLNHQDAQRKWRAIDIKAFLGVPIISGQDCLGALTVFNTQTRRKFTERDRELAESIGRQAAVTIEHARMFAEAQQRATAMANALNRQEELDRLKNQFIHSVSHELRTPLGIIYGHAELLESGDMGPLAEMQKNSIQIITRRVRMLTDLVEDLTALLAAETQELRRDLINPLQLAYTVLAEYRIQAESRGITLASDIAETLPWLHGDLTQLRRVFDNLLSNAFKFTPEGGTVTLHAAAGDDQVIFAVGDTGEGIDPEQLPRIFERFYQVKGRDNKPRRKGTGLGLALVKEIIEAHRGTVSVESALDKGTTFTMTLPGVKPPEA